MSSRRVRLPYVAVQPSLPHVVADLVAPDSTVAAEDCWVSCYAPGRDGAQPASVHGKIRLTEADRDVSDRALECSVREGALRVDMVSQVRRSSPVPGLPVRLPLTTRHRARSRRGRKSVAVHRRVSGPLRLRHDRPLPGGHAQLPRLPDRLAQPDDARIAPAVVLPTRHTRKEGRHRDVRAQQRRRPQGRHRRRRRTRDRGRRRPAGAPRHGADFGSRGETDQGEGNGVAGSRRRCHRRCVRELDTLPGRGEPNSVPSPS